MPEDKTIRPEQTVNEVIQRHPATAAVFARRGLDLCCGGAHPIRMAAAAHGVDERELLDELEKAAGEASVPPVTAPGGRTLRLDVRGLEPPEPMARILTTLAEVGPENVLEVTHFREPFPLYERLEAAGFEHKTEKLADDRYLITIRRRSA